MESNKEEEEVHLPYQRSEVRAGMDAGDGARPVRLIISMIKWIRTSRLSAKNSLSAGDDLAGLGDGAGPDGGGVSGPCLD